MTPWLLIRADADSRIGVGHVMRCLALAQAWQDSGGEAVFAAAELPTGLEQRLRREGFQIARIPAPIGGSEDADATREVACRHDAAWVAVDGYAFSESYLDALHEAGRRVLALDDMAHLGRYPIAVLLNQNLTATAAAYRGRVGASTSLLLGPRFSLLRREFREAMPDRRPPLHEPRRILVTFGGGDSENLTGEVLRSLQRTARRDLHVIVLAGAANPHVSLLCKMAAEAAFPCEVRVDVPNVAELMVWADAAISSAGSTVWELASLRLPALVGATGNDQLMGLSSLAQISHLRAMDAKSLVSTDIADQLERLWEESANRPGGEWDAFGATRVVQFLKSGVPGELEVAAQIL